MIAAPNGRSRREAASHAQHGSDAGGRANVRAIDQAYTTESMPQANAVPAEQIPTNPCTKSSVCTRWAGRHPVAAVAAAAGVGLFAGWLIKRKLFSS